MNFDEALQSAAVAVLNDNRPAELPEGVTIRQERDVTPKDRPALYFLTENPKRPHARFHQLELVLVAEVRRAAEGEGAEESTSAASRHDAAARAFYTLVPLLADRLRAAGYRLHRLYPLAPATEPDGESGWKFTARWGIWAAEV